VGFTVLTIVVGGMVVLKRRSALEGAVANDGVDAAEHLTDNEARANGGERTSLGVAFGLGKGVVIKVNGAIPKGGRVTVTKVVDREQGLEIGTGGKDAATGFAGDLVEAIEEIEVKNGTGRRVWMKKALGVGKGGVHSVIKTTRDGNAKLSSWEEMTGEGVSEDSCVNGGSETAPGSADADRTKFAKVTSRIFVKGDEVE